MTRYRCPACGTRRTDWRLMLAHRAASGHKPCNCGGYHYPHGPRSPCCEQNPKSLLMQAHRAGSNKEVLLTLAADWAWDHPGPATDQPPF